MTVASGQPETAAERSRNPVISPVPSASRRPAGSGLRLTCLRAAYASVRTAGAYAASSATSSAIPRPMLNAPSTSASIQA